MSKNSTALVIFLTIYFLVINTFHVNSFQSYSNTTESESTDDYYSTSPQSSLENLNQTDFDPNAEYLNETNSEEEYIDYEGEVTYNTDENCNKETIFDRLKAIYKENKDVKIVKNVDHINDTLDIVDRLVKTAMDLLRPRLSERDMSLILEILYAIDLPNDCLLSLIRIGNAIRREELWAFKFIDSMGHIPTGIAEGSISHFGEYDECIEIESPESDSEEKIRGQYCLAKVILPYPKAQSYKKNEPISNRRYFERLVAFLKNYNMDNYLTVNKLIEILNNQRGATVRFGTCLPSTCRAEDIEALINKIIHPITHLPIELMPDCYIKDEIKDYDIFPKISIFVLLLIILISITSTVAEILMKYYYNITSDQMSLDKEQKAIECLRLQKIVSCFSITSNIKLFVAKNRGSKRFVCIDAIRLLLIINVCVDHMYLFTPFMSTVAFKRILNSVITKVYYYNKYFFARNILIIDTIFMISGLLVSYGLLEKLSKNNGRFSYITYTIRLWLKYTIPMFVVILLFWLLPLTGDGPIWNYGLNLVVPSCKDGFSLLSSFLYFSNYRIRSDHNVFNFGPGFAICNPPTWFLSALFQLQIIAPLVVLLIHRSPKFGVFFTIAIILFGCYASISPKHLFNQKTYLDGLSINSLEEMTKAFVAFHMGINQYIISFFVGILVGYFVRKSQNYKNLMNKTEYILWFISFSTLAFVMYWFNTLHTINTTPPKWSILLWFSFGKLFGCIAISWILFCLCIGRAAFIEKIFSWYGFQVVSRLSFGIYILHFLPLSYRLFSVRDTYVMTDKILIEFIIIDFIISAFMAFLFYILIERPFNNLMTLIFERSDGDINSERTILKNNLPQINVFTANCHETYNIKL